MNQFELVAETRDNVGKGASRRLRRDGKLPGIVYGSDKEASMITLNHNEVMHHLDREAFYSHILTLKVGDNTEKVVLKDLQRHPYKRVLLHIDLQRINENEALTMRIPLHYINEDKCAGVKKDGGIISHLVTEIDIVCLPKDLPEYIDVDMLGVNLNETLHLSDIKLPDGVQNYSLLHGGDEAQPVATVHLPKGIEEEVEGEGEEEGIEGEEGVVAAAEEADSQDSDS